MANDEETTEAEAEAAAPVGDVFISNPNLSAEDQDMEMEPVVLGPPGYASPDPATNQGALLPLGESSLEVSPDYGQTPASGEAVEEENLDEMTKAELLEKAEAAGVEGASSMNKEELKAALKGGE